MVFRTDLALETAQNAVSLSEKDFYKDEKRIGRLTVTTLKLHTAAAAKAVGKPCGTYVTVEMPALSDDEKELLEGAAVLAKALTSMLPKSGTVLTVGLGNRGITPDALGPRAADMVLATRHIRGEFARSVGLEGLRPAAVLVPGVLGQTGTESSEIVSGVCGVVNPAAIIVIDALAAGSIERLGCTVQVSDTGISPGAGVGNHRNPLNADTFGVPVIGIGVPTVVDASVIAAACGAVAEIPEQVQNLMVTPKEIDLTVNRASRLIAAGINSALQPAFSPLELISLALA